MCCEHECGYDFNQVPPARSCGTVAKRTRELTVALALASDRCGLGTFVRCRRCRRREPWISASDGRLGLPIRCADCFSRWENAV
eukprot:scaffold302_cov247-Pinguiococcus_pyrenoidosus.AAC.13